jgi:hypothetical protein
LAGVAIYGPKYDDLSLVAAPALVAYPFGLALF